MPNSPNVLNYFLGKGDVYFTPLGGVERHLGDCQLFEVQPATEYLDHYSGRDGIGAKDRTVAQRVQGTVNMTLHEITPENLALALFGEAEVNTDGKMEFAIMSEAEKVGGLRLVGTNQVGSRYQVIVDRVSVRPSDPIGFISEEWSAIQIQAEMLKVPGNIGFGTVTELADEPST